MKDITVIIPLHKFDKEVKPLLERALKSIPSEYNIAVSCGKNVKEKEIYYLNDMFENIAIVKHMDEENDDFCTLVNRMVDIVGTEWFSILEFDDEYSSIWFENVEKYRNYYNGVSVFLPLTDLFEFNENKFIGYGNEAPWATSFSNEIGVIDNDCLQQFFDFYLTGSVFKTNDWKEVGGLKPSIKLTFWYEFLLRLTNNGYKTFVIPKVGYKHYVNRKDSIYQVYRDTISEEESAWWFELAKQEYVFKEDRKKIYTKNNDEKGE